MQAPQRSTCLLLGIALIACLCTSARGEIAPQNVLVLYNTASQDSIDIANYYAQVHPGVQLLGLNNVTTDEQVSADYYLNNIRPKILPALTSSISTIVTTKDLPLRISVEQSSVSSYTDPFGVVRSVYNGYWKPYSSLESELARIDVISTWQQMGDNCYICPAGGTSYPQQALNPYYGVSAAFNYAAYYKSGYGGMRLTARLDGFTKQDVEATIDRAQQAYVIRTSPSVVMDDDPNTAMLDRMVELKDNVLTPLGQAYTYDCTSAPVTTAAGPVLGYVSHGTHSSGLLPGYIPNQLSFTLADGAVFESHESFNAYSFHLGGNVSGQGLVAEWLAKGGTAGVGNVQEPKNGRNNEANEDQMFKMLLDGKTWAEAAWSSIKQLSYVNTVVGDPLMTWKTLLPGDANKDGHVNIEDLALMSTYWQSYDPSMAGGYWWDHGDFDGDGRININDLSLMATYWGQSSSWAPAGGSGPGTFDIGAFLASVPEPPSALLAMIGVAVIVVQSSWRRRHSRLPIPPSSVFSQKPRINGPSAT